jgi:nitrogen-specific signal transduction histidine kinase/CheY-like chemotaxis protein
MKTNKPDGSVSTLDATIFPIHDKSGRIINYAFIGRDCTRELQLHRQLRQAQKMEAIGTLAGGIAHDFNNILAAIIGYAELGLYDTSEGSSCFKQIIRAGERAKEVINQILIFSRQREKELQPVNVTHVLHEIMKLLSASLPKTITIATGIESENSTVMADPSQIHQILMNLCTNAAHSMQESGGVLTLTVCTTELGSQENGLPAGMYVQLAISDTGTGIDPDIAERIFDPFFTTKGPGEGTGMGLSVAHGIVKDLGGDITVTSAPGKGSIFHVLLPLSGEAGAKQHALNTDEPTGSEHILFIDDKSDIKEIGELLLSSLGYRVTATTSGTHALERFRDAPDNFDLIITDQTMPDITGLDLACKIRAVRSDIPILLCTGYSSSVTPERLRETGITEFIMKPISRRQAAQTIRRVLDSISS